MHLRRRSTNNKHYRERTAGCRLPVKSANAENTVPTSCLLFYAVLSTSSPLLGKGDYVDCNHIQVYTEELSASVSMWTNFKYTETRILVLVFSSLHVSIFLLAAAGQPIREEKATWNVLVFSI